MQIRSLRDLKQVLIISILTFFVLFVGERLGLWEPGESQPTAKAPGISLFDAADEGNIKAVKQYLANGVDVNAKGWQGETSLHKAAHSGQKEIVELLIANGADMNAMNDEGETPLDWAILNDETEIADLLRKHGGKTGAELK